MVAAGDRIDWATSSSTIVGSVLTSGNCPAAGEHTAGVKVSYDSSTEFPLSTIVRTTQWLELSGN